MANETILKMQKEHTSGIITIINDDYFFDGYTAYPITCNCGGSISQFTQGTNICNFNHETKLYDLSIGGDIDETEYRCNDCDKEFVELYPDPDNKGNWY